MKTTVEIPDPLFRQAKAAAAQRGVPLKDFFTEAVREKLRAGKSGVAVEQPWRKAFGGLRELRQETRRINRIISREFEQIEEEDWR